MPLFRVSPDQASHMLARGELDVVDVREPFEWAGGHLPGSRHVPLAVLLRDPASHLSRDKVLFVCAHGVRSVHAAMAALAMGLNEVYSLDGGTVAWAAQGFPIERA